IKYSKDRDKLRKATSSDERFKKVERQAADLINIVTGTKVKYIKKEEDVNMCLAVEESEIIGVIIADKKRGIPQESTKQYIMEEYQKKEEEAEEYLKMYWK
ncbi:MAG: transposase, partial [Lachnospiraceae bacterium]|nr:transposase [Lachnospiraceae bacterium]